MHIYLGDRDNRHVSNTHKAGFDWHRGWEAEAQRAGLWLQLGPSEHTALSGPHSAPHSGPAPPRGTSPHLGLSCGPGAICGWPVIEL